MPRDGGMRKHSSDSAEPGALAHLAHRSHAGRVLVEASIVNVGGSGGCGERDMRETVIQTRASGTALDAVHQRRPNACWNPELQAEGVHRRLPRITHLRKCRSGELYAGGAGDSEKR